LDKVELKEDRKINPLPQLSREAVRPAHKGASETGVPSIGVLQLHCFSKAQMDAEVIDYLRGNFVRTGEPVQLLEEL
jgi:hypothetical protein